MIVDCALFMMIIIQILKLPEIERGSKIFVIVAYGLYIIYHACDYAERQLNGEDKI